MLHEENLKYDTRYLLWLAWTYFGCITKTRLFKYTENFTTKNWKFSDKNSIFIFLLKA